MIYTIGHSTHDPEQFFKIAGGRFTTLIDVRSHPTSRWPWWDHAMCERWLPFKHIKYEWCPALGGWNVRHAEWAPHFDGFGVDIRPYTKGKFPKQRIADNIEVLNGPRWTNVGLRDYSFFMTLPEFINSANHLAERIDNIAIMCAEAHWWRCHRSMISDYLWFKGVDSYHIMSPRVATPHSQVVGNRLERYEPVVLRAWGERGIDTNPSA